MRVRNDDAGQFSDPWRLVRMGWESGEWRLAIFGELSANRKTPAETAAMVVDVLTHADEPRENAHLHDELIWRDDTPDGKRSMAAWLRAAAVRKTRGGIATELRSLLLREGCKNIRTPSPPANENERAAAHLP